MPIYLALAGNNKNNNNIIIRSFVLVPKRHTPTKNADETVQYVNNKNDKL